jgi:hypothetical protein
MIALPLNVGVNRLAETCKPNAYILHAVQNVQRDFGKCDESTAVTNIRESLRFDSLPPAITIWRSAKRNIDPLSTLMSTLPSCAERFSQTILLRPSHGGIIINSVDEEMPLPNSGDRVMVV